MSIENPQDTSTMSDEEFLNQWNAGVPAPEEEHKEEPAEEPQEAAVEPEEDEPEQDPSPKEEEPEEAPESGKDEAEEAIDYEAAYKKIVGSSIRANGKDIQLRNADEAVALIQMGANYNKRMQEMKAYKPFLTMLKNAELLDEAKLSYLIDLAQKKPEAVAKLIQDSSIDLYDFDVEEQAKSYQPKSYMPDMSQVELNETLADLAAQDRVVYDKTMGILGGWDNQSADVLMKEPAIIRTLNDQMKTGLFETVWNEVQRQRMLGNLMGVKDFDAYRQVGDAMFGNQQPRPAASQPKAQANTQAKKKVAGAGKKPAAMPQDTEQDFWNMSDEEFLKMANLPY
nr:MAG TPA: hypothetical protein [Caudoviricetes sp.]